MLCIYIRFTEGCSVRGFGNKYNILNDDLIASYVLNLYFGLVID
jgi:hypothetical protein